MKPLRSALSVSLVCSVVLVSSRSAIADHKEWLAFLAGEWTSELKIWTEQDGWDEPISIDRKCRLLADGNAIVDERTSVAGGTTVVVTGWNAGKKSLVETGYTPEGVTWTIIYDSMDADSLSGVIVSADADGMSGKGKVSISKSKEKPNVFVGLWEVKNESGEVMKGEVKVEKRIGNRR